MSSTNIATLSERVNQQFASIEHLWQEVEPMETIHGLDSKGTTRVKQNISNAYEQMKEVRDSLISK